MDDMFKESRKILAKYFKNNFKSTEIDDLKVTFVANKVLKSLPTDFSIIEDKKIIDPLKKITKDPELVYKTVEYLIRKGQIIAKKQSDGKIFLAKNIK